MNVWKRLWRDEAGVVVTAETVLVGTVGVLGAVAGLSTASNAVDGELQEISYAIRSLDQSYGYCGHKTCCAWTAGSSYSQPDVASSLADLGGEGDVKPATIRDQIDSAKKRIESRPSRKPRIEERTPTPLPNDLPQPEPIPTKPKKGQTPL